MSEFYGPFPEMFSTDTRICNPFFHPPTTFLAQTRHAYRYRGVEVVSMSGRWVEAEFEAIFREHYGRIVRVTRRVLQRDSEAEEVCAEVFLRLYRTGPALPPMGWSAPGCTAPRREPRSMSCAPSGGVALKSKTKAPCKVKTPPRARSPCCCGKNVSPKCATCWQS